MKRKFILAMTSFFFCMSFFLWAENGSYSYDIKSFSSRMNQDQFNLRLISGEFQAAKEFTIPGSPGEKLVNRLFEMKVAVHKIPLATIVKMAQEYGMDPSESIPAAIVRLEAKVDLLASSVAELKQIIETHINSE